LFYNYRVEKSLLEEKEGLERLILELKEKVEKKKKEVIAEENEVRNVNAIEEYLIVIFIVIVVIIIIIVYYYFQFCCNQVSNVLPITFENLTFNFFNLFETILVRRYKCWN